MPGSGGKIAGLPAASPGRSRWGPPVSWCLTGWEDPRLPCPPWLTVFPPPAGSGGQGDYDHGYPAERMGPPVWN